MTARSVQIKLSAVGYGTVLVDGTNVEHALAGLQFESSPGNLNRLTLDMMLPEVEVETEAQILVPDATRDALVALGWRPPADDDSRGGF